MISIIAKVSIQDNTGVTCLRLIQIYNNRHRIIGNLFIGSAIRVRARRKVKCGQLFRGIFVQSRTNVWRATGSYIRSVVNRAIIIKRSEFSAIANRSNGFFFHELRESQLFNFSALTVYFALFV